MLRPGPAKWKMRHSWRMGNINELQDHEHTNSEESREDMDMEKPWWKHYKWNRLHHDWQIEHGYRRDRHRRLNSTNIGSDDRLVIGSVTLNTRAERRKLVNKNTQTRVDTQIIGTKKNTFQLELKNRFTALEEHDDIYSLNKNMTEMIQHSAISIAKPTKKQKKPKISSPTRALMKKRREMIENKTPRDHIEYVEICKTIKKKAREDIYTNKSWHSNDWNEEGHVSTWTKKQVHGTRRTWRHGEIMENKTPRDHVEYMEICKTVTKWGQISGTQRRCNMRNNLSI